MRSKYFTFYKGDIEIAKLEFRVGDIVRVSSFGWCYTGWRAARDFFKLETEPYYNYNYTKRSNKTEFKIKKIAQHCFSSRQLVCYCTDREGKDIIIGTEGLKLIKQYPLRINEKREIQLETIA